MLALTLVGATAAPLVPCTGQSEPARCPMEMAQEPDHVRCHDAEAPPAQMSCCCGSDETPAPPATNDTRISSDVPLFPTTAVADTEPAPALHVVETTTIRTRTRLLFTLFSAFLI